MHPIARARARGRPRVRHCAQPEPVLCPGLRPRARGVPGYAFLGIAMDATSTYDDRVYEVLFLFGEDGSEWWGNLFERY